MLFVGFMEDSFAFFFVITEDHLFFYTSVIITGLTDVLAKFSMSHKQINYFLFLTIM